MTLHRQCMYDAVLWLDFVMQFPFVPTELARIRVRHETEAIGPPRCVVTHQSS